MASFSRKRKRGSRMQIQLAAESHVPCFQERVGTSIPGYMIPNRLPWRPRARPSATLHEIQVRSTNARQSELVPVMIQTERSAVKRKMRPARSSCRDSRLGCPAPRRFRPALGGLPIPFESRLLQRLPDPSPRSWREGGLGTLSGKSGTSGTEMVLHNRGWGSV